MISAYMAVFDDWSICETAVQSIYDIVDEIVIVDGAYQWMEPFFRGSSRGCSKSKDEFYSAIMPFTKKVRVINGLWEDESAKRCAGYEACRGDLVIRADADEVIFFDNQAVQDFVRSDFAVAEMEMPIYVAPGLIKQGLRQETIERQAFLFKKGAVSSKEHLSYLWLVLPKSEDDRRVTKNSSLIYPKSIAFNAHLTHWRSPENALARARFYVLNYIRGGGKVSWLPHFDYSNDCSLGLLAQELPIEVLDGILLGHPIVACPPEAKNTRFQTSPLTHADEDRFCKHYWDMLSNLSTLNHTLKSDRRALVSGTDYHLDLSLPSDLEYFLLDIELSDKIRSVRARIDVLLDDASMIVIPVESIIIDYRLKFSAVIRLPEYIKPLRKTLAFCVWTGRDPLFMTMTVKG